jgi:hypothetical protein
MNLQMTILYIYLTISRKDPNIGNNSNINFEESLMNKKLENLNLEELNLKSILSYCNQKINNCNDYIIILGISINDNFLEHQ